MPDALTDALDLLSRSDIDPGHMLGVVHRLTARPSLDLLLRRMLSDATFLADVSAMSVRHANGFDKLVLATGHGYQIRLHVWHCTEGVGGRALENAHSHRWCFATRILTGSYTAWTFVPRPGADFEHYAYSPGARVDDYAMEFVGGSNLEVTSVADHQAGSMYWLDPSTVHRVSPGDSARLSSSLLVIAPPTKQSTNVFVPVAAFASAQPVGAADHMPMTTDDVLRSLEALAVALGVFLA
ncbi:MAG TPA: hypothetical protein VF069_12560 [Streptosporangiaceae bacterium]